MVEAFSRCSRLKDLIQIPPQVKELRLEIDQLLLQKIQNPEFDLSRSKAVEALHGLLATDGF